MNKPSAVETLAEWVCALQYEDIPERVLERTRCQTVSVLASMYAGLSNDAAQAVLAAATRWNKAGPCTVIPTGQKMALHEAVTANSALSMALDYDDYLYMGHTGHSAVIASWAIAEAEGSSMKELLTAQVIANELGGRLGASAVLGPQNGQAWSFIHALEGAAIAARLYRLTPAQTAHALAIALYQPSFTLWPGFMGPGSKVLTAAGPTVTGIQAAEMAREGLTGAREILEHPRKGFWASFTFASLPTMLSGLGSAWLSDTLAYKRYPGCAYIDTTLDALFDVLEQFELRHGRRLNLADVRNIHVDASLLTIEMDNLSSEHLSAFDRLSPINVNFSIPLNVGIAIVAGRHSGRQLQQRFLDEAADEIRLVAAKTTLSHDWAMSLAVTRAFAGLLGRNSPLRLLKPSDYFSVLSGYQRQLGGKKRTGLNFSALFNERGRRLVGNVARTRFRADRATRKNDRADDTAPPDLSNVDFTRFKMTFPARVTIETTTGEKLTARQDVPLGAPGQGDHVEAVREKFRTEAAERLTDSEVSASLERLENFENATLSELTALLCASSEATADAARGDAADGTAAS